MSVTTDAGAPKQASGLGAEVSSRFRSNMQTYTIILALIAIWILFAVLTGGSFSKRTEYFESVPPDDGDFLPGDRHGAL